MRKIIFSLLFLFLSLSANQAIAQGQDIDMPDGQQQEGIDTPCEDDHACLTNPLAGAGTPQEFIGSLINKLFGIIGTLALVMFIYGGLIWMTSSGSSTQVKKGRDIIIWAVVGMVVIFSAYALVRFVIQGIGA